MTIKQSSAEAWNGRLRQCMDEYKEGRLVQQTLAKKLGTDQKTVFKWLHVGQTSKKESYYFPRYETMKRIADFFSVQVGYLTGETDCKSFEMEDAADYLGLSEKALERIRLATNVESAVYPAVMDGTEARSLISAIFESEAFFGLLTEMIELNRAYFDPGISESTWAALEKKHGASLLIEAASFNPYAEKSAQTNDDPKLVEAYRDFQEAIDEMRERDVRVELQMEAMRYRVTEQFSGLLKELYPVSEPSQQRS